MRYKTISFTRKRKINPKLISQVFEFSSEDFEMSAWVEITDLDDLEAATDELEKYVNGVIQKEIEETVTRLRKIAKSRIYYREAIEAAFTVLMQSQNMDSDQILVGLERFYELLEIEQSRMY